MTKKKTDEKQIPQCDQDLIATYLTNSVCSIVPLIEGQFLSDFETSFMVEDRVYTLKLEKKDKPKEFKKKAIITIAIHLIITATILILTSGAIIKCPLWFRALFGFMIPGFSIYIVESLNKQFKIPFIIKYFQ
jgi:hypothetical protein